MSVDKKQTEIQHTFTAGNKFLRLTEKTGSHPAVNLNDFGNDIRSVRVSEIGILISLLMSVEKHLNGEEPELKEPFGDPDPKGKDRHQIVLEEGQLMPTAAQLVDSGKWKKKESSLEAKLRALDCVVDEPEEVENETALELVLNNWAILKMKPVDFRHFRIKHHELVNALEMLEKEHKPGLDGKPKPVHDLAPQFDEQDRWLACEDIVRAWTIPGVNPAFHERQKAELAIRWQVLANAIENFVRIRPHDAG